MTAQHEKEFLVSGWVVLVVLVDDAVTCSIGRPSSHSERCDPQVMSDRPIVAPCVCELLDLVQMRNRVTSHGPPIVAVGSRVPRMGPSVARM